MDRPVGGGQQEVMIKSRNMWVIKISQEPSQPWMEELEECSETKGPEVFCVTLVSRERHRHKHRWLGQ